MGGRSPLLVIDDTIPAEGSAFLNDTNFVAWSESPGNAVMEIIVDLGGLYYVDDIRCSVDNNDDYIITYSTNNIDWSLLLSISKDIGNSNDGMDTFSTIQNDPDTFMGEIWYEESIDFTSPVIAQYIRVKSSTEPGAGDNAKAVGEFQAIGHAVPIPGAVWLLGSGMLGLVGLRRKFRK